MKKLPFLVLLFLILCSAGTASAGFNAVSLNDASSLFNNEEWLDISVRDLSDLVVEAERRAPEQVSQAKQLLWQAQIAKEERDEQVLAQMYEINQLIDELKSEPCRNNTSTIEKQPAHEKTAPDWLGVLPVILFLLAGLLIYGMYNWDEPG